ncbi:hypothetical protein SDC9_163752 [bioreactor metagenome]|uniref:Uncharacterized protein n=1 Tax=bioreactor metagenome TaxID=1076179 RepID=A0A645FS13_9ZZZZ
MVCGWQGAYSRPADLSRAGGVCDLHDPPGGRKSHHRHGDPKLWPLSCGGDGHGASGLRVPRQERRRAEGISEIRRGSNCKRQADHRAEDARLDGRLSAGRGRRHRRGRERLRCDYARGAEQVLAQI